MDKDIRPTAEAIKPLVEAELRRAFDADLSLVGVAETRAQTLIAFEDPALIREVEALTRTALEADEEFMAEIGRTKREMEAG